MFTHFSLEWIPREVSQFAVSSEKGINGGDSKIINISAGRSEDKGKGQPKGAETKQVKGQTFVKDFFKFQETER